ncbi:hypothetical protein WAI453_007781 [Rhynchosporium graminicola]
MFWQQNTFYFAAINESGRSLGISRTLKVMGQVASRMIQNLTIRMPNHSIEYVGFGKVIKTLGSRARLGHFRKLEMAWNAAAIVDLMNMSSLNTPQDFEGSLDEMSEAFDGVRFERVVRISTYPRSTGDIQNERDEENVESTYKLFGRVDKWCSPQAGLSEPAQSQSCNTCSGCTVYASCTYTTL